jgi:hypothetical protein
VILYWTEIAADCAAPLSEFVNGTDDEMLTTSWQSLLMGKKAGLCSGFLTGSRVPKWLSEPRRRLPPSRISSSSRYGTATAMS